MSNPKEWSPRGLKVWIVEYRHRHGTDLSVMGSEAKAVRRAADIVADNLVEVDDERVAEKIRGHLDREEWTEALSEWADYQARADNEEISWAAWTVE